MKDVFVPDAKYEMNKKPDVQYGRTGTQHLC